MINTKELRQGNKVMVTFTEDQAGFGKDYIGEIVAVIERKVRVKEDWHWIELDGISPIPLTPEILEKAGFKKIYHEDFSDSFILNVSTEGVIKWEDDGSILINDRLDDGIGYATNCVCKYVHQLQNLIHSLTGQELTINL